MNDESILITVKAVDEASGQLKAVQEQIGGVSAKAAEAGVTLKQVGASLTDLGSKMTVGVTLPIVGGLVEATKTAMDFNQQMLLIQTQAGASKDEVQNMTDAILAMGGAVEQTPAELAKGLYYIESAGYRGRDALVALSAATQLSSVGQSDMQTTSNALISVLKSMPGSFQNAGEAAAQMNAIVGSGKMRMDDLNSAIGTGFLATAHTFGVSLQSVGSALAFMTNQGIPATDAATKLKMGITLLGAPTTQAVKDLGALGISMSDAKAATDEIATALSNAHIKQSALAEDLRKPNGLVLAISDLKSHLDSSGVSAEVSAEIIAKAFGGGRTGTAIMAMVNDVNGLQASYDAVGASASKFAEDVQAQAESPLSKYKETVGSIQTTLISLGDKILPTVSRLFEELNSKLQDFTTWWGTLSPQTQDFLIKLSLGVAAIGPLMVGLGLAIKTFENLKVVWEGLGTAIDFTKKWGEEIVKFVSKSAVASADVAKGWATSAADTVSSFVKMSYEAIKNAVIASVAWIKSAVESAVQWAVSVAKIVAGYIMVGVRAVEQAAISAAAWIKSAVDSGEGVIPALAKLISHYVAVGLEAIRNAAIASAAWIKSSVESMLQWTADTAKIIGQFVLTSASAVKEAVITSVAWVKSSAESLASWLLNLPKVVAEFIATSASAVLNAVATSVAWVLSAASSSAAWVVQTVVIIAKFVAISAAAAIQATAAGLSWAGAALIGQTAMAALAGPLGIGLVIAALAAAIVQVYRLIDAWNGLQTDKQGLKTQSAKDDYNNSLNWFQKLIPGVVAKADGGPVYASGGFSSWGTDTVPAMLTPGEMVLNKSQQSKLFKMLNDGSSGGINITINGNVDSAERVRELALEVSREIGRNNRWILNGAY